MGEENPGVRDGAGVRDGVGVDVDQLADNGSVAVTTEAMAGAGLLPQAAKLLVVKARSRSAANAVAGLLLLAILLCEVIQAGLGTG